MNKSEIKNYLIIVFVIVEILSMIFNFYFLKITIGSQEFRVNVSVLFFCMGFFIVDIIADQFSPNEANQFIFYKFFSQTIFLILSAMMVKIHHLENTELSIILHKSPWMMVAGLIATFFGYYLMSYLMSFMKTGVYQGTSVFNRYLCSTLPGEILFSLIFTALCFYQYSSLQELKETFLTSAAIKIILTIIFATIVSIISKINFVMNESEKHLESFN